MAESGTVVVGGGLAGISAALRLADGGRAVTLIEGRPRLGGAAFSFRRGELTIDNGQHVFLRCCAAYRWLLERLGVTDQVVLQPRLDIPVLRARRALGPAAAAARRARAAAPVRGAGRLRAAQPGRPAARGARGAGPAPARTRPIRRWTSRRSAAFLRRHGQNDATIAALWGIIATATLNIDPDEASLALAAKVFRTGLLDHAAGLRRRLRGRAAGRAALHGRAAGAGREPASRCCSATGSSAIEPGWVVRTRGTAGTRNWRRRRGRAGHAAPRRPGRRAGPRRTARWPPRPGSAPPRSSTSTSSTTARVTDLAFAACVDSPVQWFFDRTDTSGLRREHPGGQYLAVTVSAADGIIDEPSRPLARALRGRAGPAAARGRPGRGARRVRHPRTPGHVPPGRGHAPRCARPATPACPDSGWPGRGRPPAGPTRWRARCAAGSPRPRRCCRCSRTRHWGSPHERPRRPLPSSRVRAAGAARAAGRRRRHRRSAHAADRQLPDGLVRRRRPPDRGRRRQGRAARRWPCSRPRPPAGSPPTRSPRRVAVELVHNFSLLHDDVMDRDVERRHRPTGWVVFGEGQAILAGNAMLTAAVEVLVRAGDPGRRSLPVPAQLHPAADQRPVRGPRCSRTGPAWPSTRCCTWRPARPRPCWPAARADRRRWPSTPRPDVVDGADRVRPRTRHGLPTRRRHPRRHRRPGGHRQVVLVGRAGRQAQRADRRRPARRQRGVGAGWPTLLADGPPTAEDDVALATKLIDEAGGLAWAAREADARLGRALGPSRRARLAQPGRRRRPHRAGPLRRGARPMTDRRTA